MNLRPQEKPSTSSNKKISKIYLCLRALDRVIDHLRAQIEFEEVCRKYASDEPERQLAKARILECQALVSDLSEYVWKARKVANDASRPFLRPLHIMDLPDEILLLIFQAVRGDRHQGGQRFTMSYKGGRDIQNVRLACRRFCSISDEFLIDSIRVDISYASLAKLERISNHPTISKGVDTIGVRLDTYYGVPASNIKRFAEYCIYELEENPSPLKCRIARKAWEDDVISDEEADMCVEKIEQIVRAWSVDRYDTRYNLTEEHLGYQTLLERAFGEYKRRYTQQQQLIDSGAFTARVASAMRKLAAVKRLEIRDDVWDDIRATGDCRGITSFRDLIFSNERLCKSLYEDRGLSCRAQFEWTDALTAVIGQSEQLPTSDVVPVVPELLAALGTAGVSIATLSIDLSMIPDFSRLRSTTDTGPKIASALRELKGFSFWLGDLSIHHGHHEFKAMRDFLAPIVNAEKLEELTLSLNLWDQDSAIDPASMPVVSIIESRTSRSDLSSVTLEGLPIRFSDLAHLLKSVRLSEGFVSMIGVHLMDGSWAEILEILRDRHRWAFLRSPSGAECEELSVDAYEKIFGSYYDMGEVEEELEAEQYIGRKLPANPLVHDSS